MNGRQDCRQLGTYRGTEPRPFPEWIGRRVGGRYTLRELIAASHCCAIFKGQDENQKPDGAGKGAGERTPDVIVKMARPDLDSRWMALIGSVIHIEIAILARLLGEGGLGHSDVVRILGYGGNILERTSPLNHCDQITGREGYKTIRNNLETLWYVHDSSMPPLLVLEYLKGDSLSEPEWQRLSLRKRLAIALEVALMTDRTHQAGLICHRDIKPDNVVSKSPDRNRIEGNFKLIDFGYGKMQGVYDMGLDGRIGTEFFAAPEQHEKCGGHDARTDVFGLGALSYALFCGHVPWGNEHADKVNYPMLLNPSDILFRRHIEPVMMKAMAYFPAQRYRSAREFADALGEALVRMGPEMGCQEPEAVVHQAEIIPSEQDPFVR